MSDNSKESFLFGDDLPEFEEYTPFFDEEALKKVINIMAQNDEDLLGIFYQRVEDGE